MAKQLSAKAVKLLDECAEGFVSEDVDALRSALKKLHKEAPDSMETCVWDWRLAWMEEKPEKAVKTLQDALDKFPQNPKLLRDLGWLHIELGNELEAKRLLEACVSIRPDDGDAWHELALACEAVEDIDGMKKAFRRVFEIDDSAKAEEKIFPEDAFVKLAEAALLEMPESIQEAMPDVTVFVKDYPWKWILDEEPFDPRLLGLFVGPTMEEERSSGYPGGIPSGIYLFRKNLERICTDPEDLAEEIQMTVHHEVGHYLGLDEEELEERGLG